MTLDRWRENQPTFCVSSKMFMTALRFAIKAGLPRPSRAGGRGASGIVRNGGKPATV